MWMKHIRCQKKYVIFGIVCINIGRQMWMMLTNKKVFLNDLMDVFLSEKYAL